MKTILRVTALPFLIALMPLVVIACGDGPETQPVPQGATVSVPVTPPNSQIPFGTEVQTDPSFPFRVFIDPNGEETIICRDPSEWVMSMHADLVTPIRVTDDHTRKPMIVRGFFFGTCSDAANNALIVEFQTAVLAAIPQIVASRSWRSTEEIKVFIQDEIDRQAETLPKELRDQYNSVTRGEFFRLDAGPVSDLS